MNMKQSIFQCQLCYFFSETARIMPAAYGRYRAIRKYNAHMDIRKNLYDRYYAPTSVKRRGYVLAICGKYF